MNCPICKTATLQAMSLPTGSAGEGLSARECSVCHGHWVEGELYLTWVQAHRNSAAGDLASPASDMPLLQTSDSTKAKLCPNCGRLLTRAKVGRGLSFHLDRCGTCAGFWFDAGEWDALLAHHLHTEAHRFFRIRGRRKSSAKSADFNMSD